MSNFAPFSKLIHTQYERMAKHELFVMGNNADAVWDKYLASFPAGTDPIYSTRTEHNCSCCRQFIKNMGNLVAFIDGKLETIWDVKDAEHPYDVVSAQMAGYVRSLQIAHVFRTKEPSAGAPHTTQLLPEGGSIKWNHFHGTTTSRHLTGTPGKVIGDFNANFSVAKRGLEDFAPEHVRTVLDLIDSNALYRGAEHKAAVIAFDKLQRAYLSRASHARDQFLWENISLLNSRFRNTVIGTLVQDLSDGTDLEAAVRSFEAKVAPTNYKRPTALITKSMISDAMKTLKDMDLEPALERRFAKISDVSVNDVLWVNNAVRSKMKGGVEDLLNAAVSQTAPNTQTAEAISIDNFMAMLPQLTEIGVMFKSTHVNNLMSLTAPVHTEVEPLFKWGNNFGWSYKGNITDSIKERVKAAGGNVTNAKMRVSLAWFNHDDLDIHIHEPNGNHIYYCNKSNKQDVDMNAGGGTTRIPVENVSWTSVMDGTYYVEVNQYSQRETSDVGFVIEIENAGKLSQFSYTKPLHSRETVGAMLIHVRGGQIVEIAPGLDMVGGGISQEEWAIKTETFVPVSTMMFSPNYWGDNASGNKHWLFVLEGCKNPEAARGIYNEFLNSKLDKHRKVFEVLGDKTKCPPAEEQLSGLGFSSTRGDTITVQVAGPKLRKLFNITF